MKSNYLGRRFQNAARSISSFSREMAEVRTAFDGKAARIHRKIQRWLSQSPYHKSRQHQSRWSSRFWEKLLSPALWYHMLCTFSGDNHVLVIHYTAPALGTSRALRSISFKDFGIKAEVKETMFSFEELLKQQVCSKKTTLMQKSLPPTLLLGS